MSEATIKVEGMTCGGCVRSVTAALKGQPGVLEAEVSLDVGEARVRYDAATTSVADLRKVVEDVGFDSPA